MISLVDGEATRHAQTASTLAQCTGRRVQRPNREDWCNRLRSDAMKRFQFSTLSLACVLGAAGVLVAGPATAQTLAGHAMVAPTDLKWTDVPSLPPGAKIAVLEGPMNKAVPFTARLRMPANYRIPAHWHPAVEHVTVLSGALYLGAGETLDLAKGMALRAGGFAVMPAKAPHYAYTTNEAVEIQLHGVGPWGVTYLNPADDPRAKQQ
jgi:quercetin dioxygenase-like cupin family protein